jgi:Tfp pilus assembly ATPase PilU
MASVSRHSYGGAANERCVVLINGAFGVGKSTVASAFHQRVKGSGMYDPERIGYVLRRLPHWIPGSAAKLEDYRTSPVWRPS